MKLEISSSNGKKTYPGAKFLKEYQSEELETAWAETLEIIANSNGDPNLLFKIGKLPFIFKMNGDTNPEYAAHQFEEYIEENIESLKRFKVAPIKDFKNDMELYPVPDFEIGRLKEMGLALDRANEIMIFFKSLMFQEVRNSIQGLKSWNFIFDNKSDSNDLIPAIGNEFDVKINAKNFEDFDRLIKREVNSKMQINDLRKEVDRLYKEDGENFEKFSKKMEMFLSIVYSGNAKLLSLESEIEIPDSMLHGEIFLILTGRMPECLKIIKRTFPHLYDDLEADIQKVKSGEVGPYYDPFKLGQKTIEEIAAAVKGDYFMEDERISQLNECLIVTAIASSEKRKAEAALQNAKSRKLPTAKIEEDMRMTEKKNRIDFDLLIDTFHPHILDIYQILEILDGEINSGEHNEALKKIGVSGLKEIFGHLFKRASYLSATSMRHIVATNYYSKPVQSRLSGLKKELKEYFKADPHGYNSSNLHLALVSSDDVIENLKLSIDDEEIFSGFMNIAKNLNNIGSAFAIKILSMWAKGDDGKISKVIAGLFKNEEDYKDADETLRLKLFLFIKKSDANIDFVIRRLLCNSDAIVNGFKKDRCVMPAGVLDAFDEENTRRIFKELFDSPRQLSKINGFKKPADFNKDKSLKEIEAEASIALAEPIYVDMSDCLPAGFMVKLLPVIKASENDFSWAVEISFRDFKGKPIHEKASGRFENLKFKFGFQGEFRDIFEEISVLASHRYFVRDCAEANTRRISDKIREMIDKNKANETEEDKTVSPRSSGALSVDISRQDKSDDAETKNRLSEKNVKSNILIRKIIDGKAITDEEVKDLLVFRSSNLGAGKNIYSRIPAEELIEWNSVGDLKAFIMNDDCFVMTTLAHSQAAGFYVKGFESDAGDILYGICPKKPTDYSKLAHEEYLNSGFNPVSVSPYKSKLSVKADGNVEVGTAKISLEGSDEIMVETMAVRESLNRQIAKKTASAEFIAEWVTEQIRIFKIENPNASDADLDNFIEEQVNVLSENKVLDSETVKLFLPGKYETQRVFNQGVYKKLSEVFEKE